MLAYVVLLLAFFYLIMHYTGLFDEVAKFLGGSSRRPSTGKRRGAAEKDDLTKRLQVFEDFFGQSTDDKSDE